MPGQPPPTAMSQHGLHYTMKEGIVSSSMEVGGVEVPSHPIPSQFRGAHASHLPYY